VAIRVFSDDQGRECFQLGRLSGGRLGTVLSGQFRAFAGNPVGTCGNLTKDRVLAVFERRAHPSGRSSTGSAPARAPVTVKLDGETRRVTPGGLGGFVIVFEGLRDVGGATLRTTVNGRPVKRRF